MKKVLLTLILSLTLSLGSMTAQNNCFGDWRYITPVTVTNPNGQLTDFQVKITLNSQALIAAGKMNADGSDIRITGPDCCTPLPYWIQGNINSASADIWVRVPNIAPSSSTDLAVYYGNAAANTPVSNLDSTLLVMGNDDTGSDTYSGGQTIATRLYTFPHPVQTVRWRIYSTDSTSIRFKVVDPAGIVDGVSPTVTTSSTPGFNTYDLEVPGDGNSSPAWYSDSAVNFLNTCVPVTPCPGSCGDNIYSNGDTGAGSAPGLQNDSCGFYPSMKVWYRNFAGAFIDPTVGLGTEFDRQGTAIVASASQDTICNGDTTTLSVASAGAMSYLWYNTSGTFFGNGLSIMVNQGGTYSTVADFGACRTAVSNPVLITATAPQVDLGPDRTVCTDSTYTIDAGSGYASYQWSNGSTGQTVTVGITGLYWVDVTDSANCTTSDTVFLTLRNNPVPVIVPSDTAQLCMGDTVILDAFDADWFIYEWSPNLETSSNIVVTQPGVYSVQVTDSFGCKGGSAPVNVSFYPTTQVVLPADTIICEEDSLVLEAGGPWASILWADSVTNQLTYTVSTDGNYWIEVADDNGCISRDTIEVSNYAPPTVYLGNDTAICPVESFTVDAGSGFASYLWSDNTTASTAVVGVGSHFVMLTSPEGCNGISSVLNVTALPSASVPTITFSAGFLSTNNAGPAYQWYLEGVAIPNATSSSYRPTEDGSYTLSVTDATNCASFQSEAIVVVLDLTAEDIPEGISPNGDNLNDQFVIDNLFVLYPNHSLTIISRWGEEVFSAAPYQNNFDGTYEGKDLPDGTYFYILDFGVDNREPLNGYLIINR